MDGLRPYFQRPRWMISFGLVNAAGIFVFISASTVHAGQLPSPPRWIRSEMEAINLYQAGINQENSDPQGAVKTLRQARVESTAAIANGGSSNWAVVHNDRLIGRALMMAEADASKTPEVTKITETQNSVSVHPTRTAANHIQAAINIKRAIK